MPLLVPSLRRWVVGVGLGCALASAQAADIHAYTEDWPPYNFTENGQVRGISTDILRAACTRARLECSVELVPWARAYNVGARVQECQHRAQCPGLHHRPQARP